MYHIYGIFNQGQILSDWTAYFVKKILTAEMVNLWQTDYNSFPEEEQITLFL
jgi:hypothetical protein